MINNKNKIIKLSDGIFFTNEKTHRYFHWMFDSIPRLELMKQRNLLERKILLIDSETYENNFTRETTKLYSSEIQICKKIRFIK